jgi:hypothetical protein
VVYVFEFFVNEGGHRQPLDWVTHRAKSVDQARDHARAMMRNVKVRDRLPNECLVKDQLGKTLSIVPASA